MDPVESSPGMEPRTVVGRWLLATGTLQDATRLRQLGKQINGGEPGFNVDEPAVVSCACHLALLELQEQRGLSALTELVDGALRHVRAERRPTRESLFATGAATLRQPVAEVLGHGPVLVFELQSLLFTVACLSLALRPLEVARLVVQGEELAIELNFRPPLAH